MIIANLDNLDIYLQRSLAIKPTTVVKDANLDLDNLEIYLQRYLAIKPPTVVEVI